MSILILLSCDEIKNTLSDSDSQNTITGTLTYRNIETMANSSATSPAIWTDVQNNKQTVSYTITPTVSGVEVRDDGTVILRDNSLLATGSVTTYTIIATATGDYSGIVHSSKISITITSIPVTGTLSFENISTLYGDTVTRTPIWTDVVDSNQQFNYYSILRNGEKIPGIDIDFTDGEINVTSHVTTAASGTYTIIAKGKNDYFSTDTISASFTITINMRTLSGLSYSDINTRSGAAITKAPIWTPFLSNLAETITYRITNQPTGVSIDTNTGVVSVANTLVTGSYTATITATGSDSCTGSDSAPITINVADSIDTSDTLNTIIPLTPAELGGTGVSYEIARHDIGDSTNAHYNYVSPTIDINTGEVSIKDNTSAGLYLITGISDTNSIERVFFITKVVANKNELVNELQAGIANYGTTANLNYIMTGSVTDMSSLFANNSSFNGDISAWDVSSVTDMSNMFQNASAFNQDIGSWDVSKVRNMSHMFDSSSSHVPNAFNGDISEWVVSSVNDMSYMFASNVIKTNAFNGDISQWKVINVINMEHMFDSAITFNGDISTWNVDNVTNMSWMFSGGLQSHTFNGDISSWNVGNVGNMQGMFHGTSKFNRDLTEWDVKNVTNMREMFQSAIVFNGNITTWVVSNVTDMAFMFHYTETFNQDISAWDVSKVEDMSSMFADTIAFNQDIGWDGTNGWNVGNVKLMGGMFNNAEAFNQDIGGWNVSNVSQMYKMFQFADAFNQDISGWDVSQVRYLNRMFQSATAFNQNLEDWKEHWPLENGKTASTIGTSNMFLDSGVINGVGIIGSDEYVAPVGAPSWY